MSDKPREFWIPEMHLGGDYYVMAENVSEEPIKIGDIVYSGYEASDAKVVKVHHVIEYSAYEKAVEALEIYSKEHNDSGLGACSAAFRKDAKCTCGAALATRTLRELGETE